MTSKCKIAICRHIKTNGHRCQSPALAGKSLCFFHRNLHRTHRRPLTAEKLVSTWQEESLKAFRLAGEDPLAIARAYPKQNEFHFPALEDAESVQLAASMLFQAIATRQIHFKRVRMLLYTLKIACINQRALIVSAKAETTPPSTRVVRTTHGHALAGSVPETRRRLPGQAKWRRSLMKSVFWKQIIWNQYFALWTSS